MRNPEDRTPAEAREIGRLMTAHKVATDPEAKARVESVYGVAYCQQRYPEAYVSTNNRAGFSKMLDRVRAAIPW